MSRKNKHDHLIRFQELLREIFQFDFADLDTGIYRLFRLREKELCRFIEEALPAEVDAAFGTDTSEQRQQAQEKVDELADKIQEELGDDALDASGDLADAFRKTPVGKQYLAARKALNEISANESDRDEVFNHLYTFFSRYYEDADFIPKRRYSRRPDTYAVPYSGEEVMFHWATRGMHYIKTGEHFRDYRFKVDTLEGACNTHFRLTEADIPKDNTKGDRRWFFPLSKGIEWDEATRTLTLPFHYRLPTEKEAAEHGKNSKVQHSVLAAAEKKILDKVAKDAPFLQAKLAEAVEDDEDSYLLRRMGHFARRHSADYFIYPELRIFLERELEFYVKDQMLHLDDLEGDLDTRLRLIRVVRGIAEKIIEFLDAIEQLQNRLFEKPKFVLATDWLLHIRHVSEKLWPEILKSKAQKAAWRNLFSTPAKVDKRYLKTHPTLVLDTQHFDTGFKRRLLEQLPFESIEEATDGLLVHSENWQALNLLQHKYAGKVKCIYIDPPYNTGSDEFIYKDRYRHSSWMSMMEERLSIINNLNARDGTIVCSIDDIELANLYILLRRTYKDDKELACLTWDRNRKNDATFFSVGHEYMLVFAKDREYLRSTGKKFRELKPGVDDAKKRFNSIWRKQKGDIDAVLADWRLYVQQHNNPEVKKILSKYPKISKRGPYRDDGNINWPGKGGPRYEVKHPVTEKPCKLPKSGWRYSKVERFWEQYDKGNISFGTDETTVPGVIYYLFESPYQVMGSVFWSYAQTAFDDFDALFGERVFENPKNWKDIKRVTSYLTSGNDWIADFFSGSGTAGHSVIEQVRDEGERRKFMLAEMGAYFSSILLPRLQKIIYAQNWKDGNPKDEPVFDDLLGDTALPDWVERSPRLVKVLRLESYEDSLQNLVSREETKPGTDEPDTTLRYLFERAGDGAATLLNVEQLEHPFDYQLEVLGKDGPRERSIDLVETANMLLGLDVVKYETWTAPDKRDYLAVHAQKDGRNWLVLWRDMADLDIKVERKFLEPKIKTFDEVRINGDSAVPGIRSIDLDLARAMGAA